MALQFVPRCPAPGADGLRPSKLGAPWHIQGGGLFAMVCQGGEGMLEGAMATRVTAKNRGPPLHPTPVAPLGGSGAPPSALGGVARMTMSPPPPPSSPPIFALQLPGLPTSSCVRIPTGSPGTRWPWGCWQGLPPALPSAPSCGCRAGFSSPALSSRRIRPPFGWATAPFASPAWFN